MRIASAMRPQPLSTVSSVTAPPPLPIRQQGHNLRVHRVFVMMKRGNRTAARPPSPLRSALHDRVRWPSRQNSLPVYQLLWKEDMSMLETAKTINGSKLISVNSLFTAFALRRHRGDSYSMPPAGMANKTGLSYEPQLRSVRVRGVTKSKFIIISINANYRPHVTAQVRNIGPQNLTKYYLLS